MGLAVEDLLPVRAEGFDEGVLDRLVVLVTRIELAAALRLAQMDPIVGAIAGAGKARSLAERFGYRHAMLYRRVRSRPALRKRSRSAARDIRWRARPWQ